MRKNERTRGREDERTRGREPALGLTAHLRGSPPQHSAGRSRMEGWMKDRRMKRKTERRDEGTDERLQGAKGSPCRK